MVKKRVFNDEEKVKMNEVVDKYNLKLDFTDTFTYDAIGCEKCHNTGYLGRIAIIEILDFNENIKELILNGASTFEIKKKALEEGYLPLEVDGIQKVLDGKTTLDELDKKLVLFDK